MCMYLCLIKSRQCPSKNHIDRTIRQIKLFHLSCALRLLGLSCSWWHLGQANKVVASSILLTLHKFKVWMTIEWVECMGVASGCG